MCQLITNSSILKSFANFLRHIGSYLSLCPPQPLRLLDPFSLNSFVVCLPGTPVNQPYHFIALQPDSSDTTAACCQADDNLLSCIPASVDREALGQPRIKLPQDLVLDYEGSDGSVFQYSRGGAGGVVGGAAATISCQEEEGGGCRGEAYGAGGQVYVLDYCGQQEGHVWKQLDLSTNYEEVRRVVRAIV